MIQTILVVDDDPRILELLNSYLTSHNYDVYITTDGRNALQILSQILVDLVITDLVMPNMDGIELIKVLKKQKSQIKIIAMSRGGSGLGSNLDIAKILGANAILEKPFMPDKLLETIHNLSD